MNGTKLGFFALIFLFSATILVPVLLTDIASADCGAYVGDLLRCDLYGCAWIRQLEPARPRFVYGNMRHQVNQYLFLLLIRFCLSGE